MHPRFSYTSRLRGRCDRDRNGVALGERTLQGGVDQVVIAGIGSDAYRRGMADSAQEAAAALLAAMGDRWLHVQAVAGRAAQLAQGLSSHDRRPLLAAAWLHDLGYAPSVAITGFHALDGATFLRDAGWDARVCALVAHHSCAQFEAEERGMVQGLDMWPREEGRVADALLAADMTSGPQGQPLHVEERIREILERYPDNSPVHRANARAAPTITAAVERAEERLRSAKVRLRTAL
jgi:HD domain